MIKLSKKRVLALYDRCLSVVKRKPPEFFSLRRMRGFDGSCNWTDIELGYNSNLLGTAYHELVHLLYPDWCETQVLYAESRLVNTCSPFQNAKFLKYLFIKIHKAEQQKDSLKKAKKRKKYHKNKPLKRNKIQN
jgi:hypothetical protein